MLTFGSVCSGVEAASVAWHPLGWRATWLAEIEAKPSRVLAHHYPDVPNLGDMTKLAAMVLRGEIDAPDVLVGGTPCQAYSIAGFRAGLNDPRGMLTIKFMELANAIDFIRARNGKPPCIIVWENVVGVLSDKTNAFGCFLAGLAGEDVELQPTGERWSNAGCVYGPQRAIAWRSLDAQYFGVAQRRRRIILVSSAGNWIDPATVLFEFEGGNRKDSPPEIRQQHRPQGTEGYTFCRFRRTDSYVADSISSTLTARDYKDARDLLVCPDGRVRGLTAEEYEALQGFPKGYTAVPGLDEGDRRKAMGNSMAVPKMRWLGKRIDAACRQQAGTGKMVA